MKKLFALLLAVTMLVSMAAALTASAEEPVEVVIVTKTLGNGTPEDKKDDFIYQKLVEEIGVAVNFVKLDDYYTALNARISGGDVPDVFFLDSSYLQTYVTGELLLDLTPYMETELAFLFNTWIEGADYHAQMFDGRLYMLPKTAPANQLLYNIRQDWLDNLGLKVPTTVQELYDVAYAFAFKDPDGDKQDNTYGFSSQKGFWAYDTIAMCYDCALGNYVLIRDGKVTNALLQPGMKDALTWCKKFQADGVMDPENYTVSAVDKAYSGIVGLLTNTWPGIYKAAYMKKFTDTNPEAKIIAFGPLKSEVGAEAMMGVKSPVNASGYVVSSAISEEKLNAFFKYVHYITEDTDGKNLVFYGLQGDHWNYDENGKIKMTDNAKAANYISHYQIFSRNERSYLEVKFPEATYEYEYALDAPLMSYYNALVVEPDYMYLSDMEKYINTTLLEFIYGERPIEEYDAFIQELNDSYFFDKYMEAAAEQLAAYGYVE